MSPIAPRLKKTFQSRLRRAIVEARSPGKLLYKACQSILKKEQKLQQIVTKIEGQETTGVKLRILE